MVLKLAVRLGLILALQGCWVATAHAQSPPAQLSLCNWFRTANDLGVDLGNPPPLGAWVYYQNTVPGESGETVYAIPKPGCAPPCPTCCPVHGGPGASGGGPGASGGAPGASSGGPAGTVATCGKPINLATGDTYVTETDVKVPGIAGGLSLARTWNSLWAPAESSFQLGLFGLSWRSSYEERIFLAGDGYLTYLRGDGSFWTFAWASGTTYAVAVPGNADAVLSLDSNYTQWTLTFQNGEKRLFSYLSGSLTAIVDRNGNTTQLTYDSGNRLTTVADPGGRHLYFSYPNNTSFLVSSVTTDVGISLAYAYDSQSRLTQVTEPDLTTLTFTYDSGSRITSVTDSAGKILESHTYDSLGRGLTSSRTNGVEAVTVSYPNQ